MIIQEKPNIMWIFGYGSLLWKPGFEYSFKLIGYINGYCRRFWQSNTAHRGTQSNPGRVATLVPDSQGQVHGIAFQLVGEKQINEALQHLNGREIVNGGYTMFYTEFYPVTDVQSEIVLVYSATCDNKLYTGPESEDVLVERIVNAQGASGHNVEYVTRIAEIMRQCFPDHNDLHLQTLDELIRMKLKQRQINCVEELWSLGSSKYDDYCPRHTADELRIDKNNNEITK